MRLLRYVLFVSAFLMGFVLQAQQHTMSLQGEVALQAQDMDAAAYYPMSDENDNLCTLIKVTLTNELSNPLVLETGGLAVVKREERENGEIWFWVPSQVRNLVFSCKGYQKMEPIPVRLQVAKVYRLTLRTDAQVHTFTTVQATYAFLKMQIHPSRAANALVSIGKTLSYETDVRYAEEGFYASPLPLDYGTYYYKVEHELFGTVSGTLQLNENSTVEEVTLQPTYGYLKITSEPSGAILAVDGKRVGTTPWTSSELPAGSVQVRLQANNYSLLEEQVMVVGNGQVQPHHFQLASFLGTVTCRCDMADAEIWVDQEYKGLGSWTGQLNAQVPHMLEVRKAGHQSQSIQFSVQRGQTTTETIAPPIPMYGTLVLNTTPGACQVLIDGKSVGTSPLVQQLLVGQHKLQVSKNGYQTQDIDIQIRHNERLDHLCTLKQQTAQQTSQQAPKQQTTQQPPKKQQSSKNGMVSGKVTDAKTGEPILAASVMVKGQTASGTLTDQDGKFSLKAAENATLQVSFLGYKTATVAVNQRSVINIALEQDAPQQTEPEDPGKFQRITVRHNVTQDGVKGMNLLLDFSVKGMKGKKGRCVVYFYDKDGNKLKDKNKSYHTVDGQISVGRDIEPGYEESWYTDFTLFMPYSELELSPGTHELKYHCQVWDRSVQPNKSLLSSETYQFKVEKGANGAADQGSTVNPITGQIKDITVEHNYVKDGVKGMRILVDFNVQNMRGIDGSCDVYFYLKNGDPVKGKNSEYQTQKGTLTTSFAINPRYEDSRYTDFELFVPYSEFDLESGKYDLKFYCRIWEKSSGWKKVVDSNYQHFQFSR